MVLSNRKQQHSGSRWTLDCWHLWPWAKWLLLSLGSFTYKKRTTVPNFHALGTRKVKVNSAQERFCKEFLSIILTSGLLFWAFFWVCDDNYLSDFLHWQLSSHLDEIKTSVALMSWHGIFHWVHLFWVHPFLSLFRMFSLWVKPLSSSNCHLKSEGRLLFEASASHVGCVLRHSPLRNITLLSVGLEAPTLNSAPSCPMSHHTHSSLPPQ